MSKLLSPVPAIYPVYEKWSDVKIGSGLGFPYVGFRYALKCVKKLVQWLACPPLMQKVAGSSIPCALILMKICLN